MRSRRKRKNKGRAAAIVIAVLAVAAGLAGGSYYYIQGLKKAEIPAPDELFAQYTSYLAHGRYEDMYDMLDEQSRQEISLEDFVIRNKTYMKASRPVISSHRSVQWRSQRNMWQLSVTR